MSDEVDIVPNQNEDSALQLAWLTEPHRPLAAAAARRPLFELLFFFTPYFVQTVHYLNVLDEVC